MSCKGSGCRGHDLIAGHVAQVLIDVPAVPEGVLEVTVCADPGLAADFMRLHASLEAPTTRLQAEEGLAEWLARLIARAGTVRPARPPVDDRDDRALRVARDYLADHARRCHGEYGDGAEGAADAHTAPGSPV